MRLTYRFVSREGFGVAEAPQRALRAADAYAATSRSDYAVVGRDAADAWVDIAFDIPGIADPHDVGAAWRFALDRCGVDAHIRDANRIGA